MTNNEPIRAQWGVAMELQTVGGGDDMGVPEGSARGEERPLLAAWADRRVADGATPDDVEEPWRYLIEEAMERAKPNGRRYTVELRKGKKFEAILSYHNAGATIRAAKFQCIETAEKVAKLLNEALEAKEAGDE